jgi:hypothetical protein
MSRLDVYPQNMPHGHFEDDKFGNTYSQHYITLIHL